MTHPTQSLHRAFGVIVVLLALAAGSLTMATSARADANNCPCSLFAATDGPTGDDVDTTDDASVELGVRFSVDAAEPITALRFYKSAANVGTHVGSIWSTDGTLLARAVFTNESTSGWQQVSFSNPVLATPGTVYVASYFAPNGHYSHSAHYFGSGLDTGILHAVGGDPNAPNGLYVYSPVPAFPDASYNSNNYWVDVVVGTPVTLSSISVSPSALNLAKGASAPLSASGSYSDGASANVAPQVSWTSADPTVATVSATGVVGAVGAGTTTITATIGTVSSSIRVTVVAVSSVRITGAPASQAKGLSRSLAANAGYTDGTTADVTSTVVWASSNPAVATVSPAGLLTATGVGSATISATIAGVTGSVVTTVTPAVITTVTVTPATATLRLLSLTRLTATARYTDGTVTTVTGTAAWRSSNLLVAQVGNGSVLGGLLTALPLLGKVTVTATVAGVVGTATFTVTL